jgi:hypothetical protein
MAEQARPDHDAEPPNQPNPEGLVPAPPAPAKLARRAPPALVAAELQQLEKALGGRSAIIAALSHAPKSANLDYVLGLVADPLNRDESLAAICAQGGVTAGELLDAYREGVLLKGQVLAARVIAEELPVVASDTMRRARPHEDTCATCQGLTTVTPEPSKKDPNPSPVPCPICRGTGRLLYPGDLEHKKLALELGKLTSKGGGVNVAIDQRQAHLHAGQAAGGTLEALQRATDQVLYGGGELSGGFGPAPGHARPVPAPPTVEDGAEVEGEVVDPAPGEEFPDVDTD